MGGGRSKNSGYRARCNSCKREFTQGGRYDLAHGHLHLRARIAALNLPAEVAHEVLQQAFADVLTGEGYVWNVKLRIPEAWKMVRGEYHQQGSSHPVFRFEMC